jgi:hypothetical protein
VFAMHMLCKQGDAYTGSLKAPAKLCIFAVDTAQAQLPTSSVLLVLAGRHAQLLEASSCISAHRTDCTAVVCTVRRCLLLCQVTEGVSQGLRRSSVLGGPASACIGVHPAYRSCPRL